jgi:hypothetical protein
MKFMNNLLVLGAILAGCLSLWLMGYLLRCRHLAQTQTTWEIKWQTSNFAPVRATRFFVNLETYGERRPKYDKGATGALGLADGHIVFSNLLRDQNIQVPFEAIRWVGTKEIEYTAPLAIKGGGPFSSLEGREWRVRRECVLIVHCEFPNACDPDRWVEYVWSSPKQDELGARLAKLCGLEIAAEVGGFGPEIAIRLVPGSDTEWQGVDQGDLYLAPDRLLFNWDDPILYSSVQRVETISTVSWGCLSPFSHGSFRIDYSDTDGTAQTVGFQVFHSDEWAEQLRSRCYASHKEKPMWDKSKEKPIWDRLGQFDPPSR